MNKTIRILGIFAAVLLLVFIACGGDNGNTNDNNTNDTNDNNTNGETGTAPTITTASLPNGALYMAYNQTLTATGDTPITWSFVGTFPWELSLSTEGVISGIPTTAGTFNFTVMAANAAGNSTKALSFVVTSTYKKLADYATISPITMLPCDESASQTYVARQAGEILDRLESECEKLMNFNVPNQQFRTEVEEVEFMLYHVYQNNNDCKLIIDNSGTFYQALINAICVGASQEFRTYLEKFQQVNYLGNNVADVSRHTQYAQIRSSLTAMGVTIPDATATNTWGTLITALEDKLIETMPIDKRGENNRGGGYDLMVQIGNTNKFKGWTDNTLAVGKSPVATSRSHTRYSVRTNTVTLEAGM